MVQATTSGFKFHPKCARVNLTHLCFADDLLIFTTGDLTSIQKVKSVLEQFKEISGLQANSLKSEVSFLVFLRLASNILDCLEFKEGHLSAY